jgi:hypothetical protein
VAAWDGIDPAVSRNLLAHLRRLAEECGGSLPAVLPPLPAAANAAPVEDQAEGAANIEPILRSNGAYLEALAAHLRHHTADDLPAAHLPAVRVCAERLIQLRIAGSVQGSEAAGAWQDGKHAAACAGALRTAAGLAQAAGAAVDAARWESEAEYLLQRAGVVGEALPATAGNAGGAYLQAGSSTAIPSDDHDSDSWLGGVRTAGAAVWEGCGISYRDGELWVEPSWPSGGTWWALLSLPLANGRHLSLLWDGAVLHATQPVRSTLPVELHKRIQIHQTDEFDFDPYFELTRDSHGGDTASTQRFKPKFLAR